MGHTGQSEAIHSPDEWARTVVRLTIPPARSIAVVCTVAISCWPRVLRTISSPLDSGAYRNCRVPPSPRSPSCSSMVPTSDFSGFASSICALANAVASAAIDGLDRCMACLFTGCGQDVEADSTGFGALGAHPMADGLLGIFRNQPFQLGLGLLVLEMGRPRAREDRGKFR